MIQIWLKRKFVRICEFELVPNKIFNHYQFEDNLFHLLINSAEQMWEARGKLLGNFIVNLFDSSRDKVDNQQSPDGS